MAAGSQDRLAVERVFSLVAADVDKTAFCNAICVDGHDVSVNGSNSSALTSDLLKLAMAGLEVLGAREFLQRTSHLVPAGQQVSLRLRPATPMGRRRSVAIYGGAFDPITNAHLTCASEIVHSQCADEVWLVPCGPRLDKPNLKTPPVDRYIMCQLAVNTVFSRRFPIRVSDIECFQQEASMTYDLLCSLRERYPETDFSFIIGSDWLQPGSDMSKWESRNWNWKEGDPEDQKLVVTGHKMLSEFDLVVIKRAGYDVPPTPDDPSGLKKFGPRLRWLQMQGGATFVEGNLSSTEIRKRTQIASRIRSAVEGKHLNLIDGLVPPAVLGYILKEGFYLPAEIEKAPCTSSRTRVAIYGGTFDPITNSHLECAAQILHADNGIDQIWFVPSGVHGNVTTPALDRLAMCKLAVGTAFRFNFPVKVSDVEVFSSEPAYTYDTLCSLRERHPECDFTCIVGSEWLEGVSHLGPGIQNWVSKNLNWKPGDPEEQKLIVTGRQMLDEFDFLIMRRSGDSQDLSKYSKRMSWFLTPEGTTFIHGNMASGSSMSAEVRKRAATVKGQVEAGGMSRTLIELEGLVPHAVLNLIRRQGLYA
eukprot:TRINITY_DN18038_c0_g1_i1.p1 TRINITY_DN18038_c0_g1~~TRINITY_DN18038_c0_g1_i1.p1  ORF type:complete len:623 (-),score=124.44 TRINITY_DN18038_c0_g1_i1:183-1949(-)